MNIFVFCTFVIVPENPSSRGAAQLPSVLLPQTVTSSWPPFSPDSDKCFEPHPCNPGFSTAFPLVWCGPGGAAAGWSGVDMNCSGFCSPALNGSDPARGQEEEGRAAN